MCWIMDDFLRIFFQFINFTFVCTVKSFHDILISLTVLFVYGIPLDS